MVCDDSDWAGLTGGLLWFSEFQRPLTEQVTRLLGCSARQGQQVWWLVRTGFVLPAHAAASRSGVQCQVLEGVPAEASC